MSILDVVGFTLLFLIVWHGSEVVAHAAAALGRWLDGPSGGLPPRPSAGSHRP